MRSQLQFLKNIDRRLAVYIALLAISVVAAAGMTWRLGALRSDLSAMEDELAAREREVADIIPPTAEEQRQWTTTENMLVSRLLSDSETPVFLNDITRLATDNQLDLQNVEPVERSIPEDGDLSGSESLARTIGIDAYTELTITFTGNYRNTARFIGAIARLPRLTEFTSIELTRQPPEIAGRMVFRVYRRQNTPAESAEDPA